MQKLMPKQAYFSNRHNSQPKIKASVITCPICNYHCVEDSDPVLDIFQRHTKKSPQGETKHRVSRQSKSYNQLPSKLR